MYALLLAIIYAAFISLGLPDSLVGAGWPVMQRDLDVPVGYAGIITAIISAGTIVSSLASERLTRRLGAGVVTAVSVALTAAALFGFASSGSFWLLCLWAVPFGLGAGAVDAALNNYVALHYAARHMSWLHGCWGLGASVSPFVMSWAIASGRGWSSAYLTIGLVQAALAVALVASIPLWGRVNPATGARRTSGDDGDGVDGGDGAAAQAGGHAGPGHVPLARALRVPGVPLALVAFCAYCAVESTSILWASTYLVGVRGVAPVTAAAFASLFLLGITAGRFLTGFVADRLGDRALIRWGFAAVLVGVAMLAVPLDTDVLALAGLVLAGLGCAPVYPAIIHSTPANFGRGNSQAVIGIQMAAAYTGATLAPPVFGAVSSGVGLWVLPVFLAVVTVVGLLVSERLNRLVDRRVEAAAPLSEVQ